MSAANVISFDVEEHHRIEAAVGLEFAPEVQAEYSRRMEASTRRLLDQLAAAGVQGTFYVLGQIAKARPGLVRAIQSEQFAYSFWPWVPAEWIWLAHGASMLVLTVLAVPSAAAVPLVAAAWITAAALVVLQER